MIVPRFTQERCLILSDADIESMLAIAMASEQQSLSSTEPSIVVPAWWGRERKDLDLIISAIEPASHKHTQRFGLMLDQSMVLYPPETSPESTVEYSAHQSRMLTDAAYAAMDAGIKRVIWPIRIAENHPHRIKAIGDVLDRALLISRLVTLDAEKSGAPEVIIETPFVDLSDRHIGELALDMTLPISSAWWWGIDTLELARDRHQEWQQCDARQSALLEPKPDAQTTRLH